jgi:hypothetical protein
MVRSNIRHQLEIYQDIMEPKEDPLSLHLDNQRLSNRLLTKDHNTNNSVDSNNIILGLFSRTNKGSRPVGRQLLLQVPGVLDQRKGVGHVENHITSVTVQLRGPEHMDKPDPLPWEI